MGGADEKFLKTLSRGLSQNYFWGKTTRGSLFMEQQLSLAMWHFFICVQNYFFCTWVAKQAHVPQPRLHQGWTRMAENIDCLSGMGWMKKCIIVQGWDG